MGLVEKTLEEGSLRRPKSVNVRKRLRAAERLLEADVCATLQPRGDHLVRRARRHAQDNRDHGSISAQTAQCIVSERIRRHPIEHHQIDRHLVEQPVQCFVA